MIEEEELAVGDSVDIFTFPNGKFLLTKSKDGTPIDKITSAYYYLKPEVRVEEK